MVLTSFIVIIVLMNINLPHFVRLVLIGCVWQHVLQHAL